MTPFIYRAGWKWTAEGHHWTQRFGKWYVWIGPYVIGDLRRF